MTCCRREFMKGCAAYVVAGLGSMALGQRRAFAQRPLGETAAESPFARIERVGEGVWAVISTPQGGDMTTLSNGGIIAGKDTVLVVEGFMSPKGASWLREAAASLAGRAPEYVALTHYHSDHVAGVAGYAKDGVAPKVLVTGETASKVSALRDATPIGITDGAFEIDLGGRTVRIVERKGHTASDITVEVSNPHIVFCGDLLWNGLFPNYVDAQPSVLTKTVGDMLAVSDRAYIPGHGAIPDAAELANYRKLLEFVEQAARDAHAKGIPAAEAAKTFAIPDSLGTWTTFRPQFYQTALEAWERELQG